MWQNYPAVRYSKQGAIVSSLVLLAMAGVSTPAQADVSIVISQPVNAQVYAVPHTYSTVYSSPSYYVTPGSTVQTLSITPIGGHFVHPYAYPTQTRHVYGLGTTTPHRGLQVPILTPHSTLVRPVIVNSPVRNSVLVNPVLINSPIQSGTVIVTPQTVTTPGYLITPYTSVYPGQVGHPGPVIYPGTVQRRSVSTSF